MRSASSLAGDRVEPIVLGRYMLCDVIGGGGMAKVHIGKVVGAGGFSRVVAIKRLHPESALDPQVSAMLIDEARLVSRIRHPNVVPTLDVVAVGDELLLVMEYVHGISVAQLVRLAESSKEPIPLALAARIIIDVLAGLAAAHEAKSERGYYLELVHRDVSPQNILVDVTGTVRVVDFGIAKAEGKLSMTRQGQIKGKLNYMSPEQLRGDEGVDRRTDLYAAGVVLWELVCGRRLFDRQRKDLGHVVEFPASFRIDPPSKYRGAEAVFLDRVLERALAPSSEDRFADADEMAAAITGAVTPASTKDLAVYLDTLAEAHLEERNLFIERAEQLSAVHDLPREEVAHPIPAPRAEPEPESDARKWFLVVGLVMAIAVGLFLIVHSARRRAPPPDPVPVAAMASPSAPAEAEADPSVEPAVVDLPAPSPAPMTARTSVRPKPRPSPRPAAAADCSPPYSIDARGIRIPRRECLGE